MYWGSGTAVGKIISHPGPRQGLYTRNCNGRNYSFYHAWRPSWRPLFAENSRVSGGSAPGPPAGALRRAPGPHPYEKNRMFQTHTQNLACSQSFIIAFSRVSGRYVKHFSNAKVQKFWLALSARSISFFSSFLFSSQYNEQDHITSVTNTVMDILYRQTVIKQQCIYWDLRRIVCFQRRYIKKSARSLRSLATLYTLSPVSNASSFNKAIYHEHKWTY